ncbi:MAG TPA: protein phosphatase 2C domain-containing protein [Candidatus Competibacteraceae bacterium]|nr:MAG: serine/threonine-protein phosphatase [Candidatus Competibacteraceae bacterium]HOB60674.1 protein phosphatase 2C domain-containing protein [Candidatus Competibacteraceae bacterium]HQA26245.1 protein phosphatase 2C domain-containing protein [Candidatus Competibacteraceae bacterium]HQD57004.1 protein phosphatase 2C domain-containing protein [Candidatus Competibacteraceae bacterium]
MAAWIHDEGMAQGERSHQEDDYGVFELPPQLEAGELLLVLADGMGGERAGARASGLAVRVFVETYDTVSAGTIPDRLNRTLTRVNQRMEREIATDPRGLEGMGCTLLAVVLAEEGLYWLSVGDSPLWLWRRGQLRRLNQDHAYRSVLAQQVRLGEISATDAASHPDRNALVSAITGDEPELVDLPLQAYPLERGDQILLASDGVLTLNELEIAAVLAGSHADQSPCQLLLAAVAERQRPHQDNTTVLWARLAVSRSASLWHRLWRRLWPR